MAVVALGSVTGAPGATTLAVGLAACWPRRVVLVECDPDGGNLAARCGLSLSPGLTELAAAARSGLADPDDAVWRAAQGSDVGPAVVVAPPAAEKVAASLRAADKLAAGLAALSTADAIVDVGRVRPDTPAAPILLRADRRLLVTGSHVDDVLAIVHRADVLDRFGAWDVIVTGGGAHSAYEVRQVTGRDVLTSRPGRRRPRGIGSSRETRWLRSLASQLASDLARDTAPDHLPGRGAAHG